MTPQAAHSRYDLLIIGAGIHGAAIARHAALEGYKVCVIEQYADAAMATSSKSSKLIHGGLRYLESFQLSLVRECLNERRILLKTAPSLVRLEKFYIPVYRHSRRSAALIWIGLRLYKLLGGGQFRKLPAAAWAGLDGLVTDQLIAVFEYHDAVTNDMLLTRAIIDDAINHGASLLTSTTLRTCRIENTDKSAVTVKLDNGSELQANMLINAAGPWVNEILKNTVPDQKPANIELVQGTHILLPRKLLAGVYYFEADDGRVLFAIPWRQYCLLGTTETPYSESPEKVEPLASEIRYLLDNWNRQFADTLTTDDVSESFAGLRVLPGADNIAPGDSTSAFHRARDTHLLCDDDQQPRMISVIGGKLTAHRATAEKVMQIVHQQLPPTETVDTRNCLIPDR